MLPWSHAALGYLLYSGWCRARFWSPPPGMGVLALGLGTQFPDLIDKPFAWSFALLPSGRSVTHSLLLVAVVGAAVILVGRRRGWTTPATAFVAGWFAHLLGDSYGYFLGLDDCAAFLLYPLTPLCGYEEDHTFVEFFLSLELTTRLVFGLSLTALGLVVWWFDGRPGLAELRSGVSWVWTSAWEPAEK